MIDPSAISTTSTHQPELTTITPGATVADEFVVGQLRNTLTDLCVPFDDNLSAALTSSSVEMRITGSTTPRITRSKRSWRLNYTVVSFMMNGQLYSEYNRLSNMLNLPPCSNSQWNRITQWLEHYVTELAEVCCQQVRSDVKERGDHLQWTASFDGFYQTRGHFSNNSSATLHDYHSGRIAWFKHRTKRGPGHNWEGTSGGAESDIFNEILGDVRDCGFNIAEMVTDKDSSVNAIYCRHFLEGTITYCSNHSAKAMHKHLQRVKQAKCLVCSNVCIVLIIIYPPLVQTVGVAQVQIS